MHSLTVSLDTVIMPPTPPSSAGSDSDGSQSPQRSAPNSPQRQSPVRLYHYHHLHHASSPDTNTCAAQTLSQPLFLSPVSPPVDEGAQVVCRLLDLVQGVGTLWAAGCQFFHFSLVLFLFFFFFHPSGSAEGSGKLFMAQDA